MYKIEIAMVRSFSIGFTIYSPKLNGFAVEVNFTCFLLRISSKGKAWFKLSNYWSKQA